MSARRYVLSKSPYDLSLNVSLYGSEWRQTSCESVTHDDEHFTSIYTDLWNSVHVFFPKSALSTLF